MTTRRLVRMLAAALVALAGFAVRHVHAQGITTGAISGTVADSTGNPIDEAQIEVVNRSTGFRTGAITRNGGRYFIQGLEVGGPYSVTARRIGFSPQTREDVMIALSQNLRLDFRLAQQAARIAAVTVTANTGDVIAPTTMGTKTTVSDTVLQRLPTLTRNLTDFIKLAPQVSTSGAGYSAGGMSNRMNNVQIDGSTERDVFGLGSTGQPGAEVSAKSVSIDAVKEFQVILAPFDVRQGNFGGLLVNAVTKSGTNDLQGSAYYYYRDEKYGRDVPQLRATPFERAQYGFTLGGPIIKDKLHFFVAPEFQKENTPVTGPYLGQPDASVIPLDIEAADLARFESIVRNNYGYDPGTAGYANIRNPLDNVFGRLDWQINANHRLVARYNYGYGENLRQQNSRNRTRAVYSSNFNQFNASKNAPVLQLYSSFSNGWFNELFVGYNRYRHRRFSPAGAFPQLSVTVPRIGGGSATIMAGTDQFSQGNELDTDTYELTENLTIPVGNHTFTLGTRNEYVKLRNLFNESSYGVWSFRSLDELEAGDASSFRRAFLLEGDGSVFFRAVQSALYAQDQWAVRPNFTVTLGARMDVSSFLNDIPYTAAIDTAYGRRTDDIPERSVQFSPRVGFNWDIGGRQVNQLRGGVGLFVGTPPYVWMENAYVNSGQIITFLSCNRDGSRDPAPAFQVDPTDIQACGNGQGSTPIGKVNFLASDLKFPQPVRAVLGFDRVLPWNLVATVEGLYSKTLNQFFFSNLNLVERGTAPDGRVLYGDTILVNGQARPFIPPRVADAGGLSRFTEAIDLTNSSRPYAWSLTGQLRKQYSDNWEALVAYTYGQAKDIQSFSSSQHASNWQFGRTIAGSHGSEDLTTSLFDQRHKIAASATYTLNWLRRFSTDFSLYYSGTSGAPHDYVYNSGPTSGSGDLNADGRTLNDLLYVPGDATNPAEIEFREIPARDDDPAITAAEQAQAFERFIEGSECLSSQRGRILERNSCRLPMLHRVDLGIRQTIPSIAGQRLAVQFDVFNLGNLLNKEWGQERVSALSSNSNVPLLTHVGQTSPDAKAARPIFQWNVNNTREYEVGDFASNFWRTQISVRYSF